MAEAVMMAGPLVSAAGALQQGKMTSQSLQTQANMQETYAKEARDQADYNAQRSELIANQKIGQTIASYGASGVSANSGSVFDVVAASAQNAELDRLNILHGGDLKAINFENQAAMDRYGAESALKGSYWSALGDVVGGGSKAASFRTQGGGGDAGASSMGGAA